jgi:hypothetical protein
MTYEYNEKSKRNVEDTLSEEYVLLKQLNISRHLLGTVLVNDSDDCIISSLISKNGENGISIK